MKPVQLMRRLGLLSIAAVGISLGLLFSLPHRWPEGAILVPRDAPTLQEALVEVEPGGTIVLQERRGPFHGPVVVATEGITIASSGTAPIVGEGEEPAISIRADRVTVKGLRVSSPAVGISVEGAGCRLERIFVDSTPLGIRVGSSSDVRLSSIRVEGSDTAFAISSTVGGSFDDLTILSSTVGITLIDSRKNLFSTVKISGGRVGISIEGSDGNGISSVVIEGCEEVGVSIAGSNENWLADVAIRGAGEGIVIENAAGNVIDGCRIEGAHVGCRLSEAVQNGIRGTDFLRIRDTGIRVEGGRENGISYNRFTRIEDTGIEIQGSARSLVLANAITGGARGIVVGGSAGSRILRNAMRGMSLVGVFIIDSGGDRILDNDLLRTPIGIAAVRSAGETVLRNRIEGSTAVGLGLLDASDDGTVSQNLISRNRVGVLITSSCRGDISGNDIRDNSIGLLIYRPGPATRIERNTVVSNTVGLKRDGELDPDLNGITRLGVNVGEGGDGRSPIIVGNLFDRNRKFDVENGGTDPLYVADNRWGAGPARALVSSGVFLPESGWKGEVAIGTADGLVGMVLGYLLRHTLIEGGYRVIDLIGLGDEGEVEAALHRGDVDIVWSTGSGIDPTGFDPLPIPAEERPVAIASERLASRLAAPTLSALSSHGGDDPLRVAAPASLPEAEGLVEAYGISPTGGIEWIDTLEGVEALLKLGATDLVIVPALEESLTLSGFVELVDDRGVAAGEPIFLICADRLTERYSDLSGLISKLIPRLTGAALHRLINRVRLFDETPEEAADGFFNEGGGYGG